MRKIRKSAILVLAFMLMTCLAMPVDAAEISRASLPSGINAESAQIVENLISDVLDEVKNGLGYAEAWGKANNLVYNAVCNHEDGGYGYGILAGITRNAIFEYRDMYLRPDYYVATEEVIRVLIDDIITSVENGKEYSEAKKEAYIRIYQSVNPWFDPGELYLTDFCYWDIPSVDSALFNRARKLLLEAESRRNAE